MTDTLRDEAQIRSILTSIAKALYAKDADSVIAQYAEGISVANLAPPLLHKGSEAWNRAAIQQWFDTWAGPINLEMRDVQIEISGDVAFAHGLSRMSGVKRDGEQPDLWMRITHCFRKERGEWKTAHIHESVPFYMDGSFRAATDLKP